MGLPKPMLDSLIPQFFLQRKILLFDKIDGQVQESVTQAILALNLSGQEPITLLIDSTGGSTISGRCIADAIRCSQAPVHGLVVGDALSMAFWILQNCQRRIAYPHARMMSHGYAMNEVRCDQKDYREKAEQLILWHAEDLGVLARRSGQSVEQWRKWSSDEHYFSASDGIRLGILDGTAPAKPLPGAETVTAS